MSTAGCAVRGLWAGVPGCWDCATRLEPRLLARESARRPGGSFGVRHRGPLTRRDSRLGTGAGVRGQVGVGGWGCVRAPVRSRLYGHGTV